MVANRLQELYLPTVLLELLPKIMALVMVHAGEET